MIREIFLILDVICLGMLLGGGLYESVVMNPNYRSNIPQSLDYIRVFLKVTTPANLFRILSPLTMIFLLLTLLICWDSISGRWWIAASFGILILADSITYGFHYPRNKVLFINSLSPDNDLLKRKAREWQIGNLVRILLILIAIISVMCGTFSILNSA